MAGKEKPERRRFIPIPRREPVREPQRVPERREQPAKPNPARTPA